MSIPGVNGDRTLYYAPLSSYLTSSTAPLSVALGNVLNSRLGNINLIRGLDWSSRIAHGQGYIFGNYRSNDHHETQSAQMSPLRTIDQVLRDNARFNTRGRDVALLGNDSRSYRRDSSGNIVNANAVASDLRGTYNYLFDGGRLPEGTGGTTTPVAHPRTASLNGVMEDYARVRNGRQISSTDRLSLDNAMDLLADIQRALPGTQQPSGGVCRHTNLAGTNADLYFMNEATMTLMANMITAAIMCDVTRIFMFNAWINENLHDRNPNEDFHQGHSHTPWSTVNGKVNWQHMAEVQHTYIRGFVAPLINGLASATDPSNGQTYLYNSLVHHTIECSQVHGLNSQPCLLAGNAGGALPSGYLLDYTDRSRPHRWVADSFSNNPSDPRFAHEYAGVPVNRIFNTILQSMGLTPSEYENSSLNTHFQNQTSGRWGAINNGIANMGGYGHWGPPTSGAGQDYFDRMPNFNLHHFKSVLPMPPRSA